VISLKDFCKELEVMFDHVVANIGFMTGSPVIQRSTDQQIVYDGYSNVSYPDQCWQGSFEAP